MSSRGSTSATISCNGLLGFGLPEDTGKPFVQALFDAKIPTGTYRYYAARCTCWRCST